jgi:hypothetical protein
MPPPKRHCGLRLFLTVGPDRLTNTCALATLGLARSKKKSEFLRLGFTVFAHGGIGCIIPDKVNTVRLFPISELNYQSELGYCLLSQGMY